MKKLILIILFLYSINSFSQSPTFQALVNLNHNVDNNRFDLETNPNKEAFSKMRSTIWNNVYFKYFKNRTVGQKQADQSMKFSIQTQFLYNLYCKNDTTLTIDLGKGTKDKLLDVKVVMFTLEADRVVKSKLKSKTYSLTKGDKNTTIQIAQGVIKQATFIQILFETESYNFKKLGPFNFMPPIPGKYDFILTANIPEMFKYSIPPNIKLDNKKIESMKLKEFTYSSPPIVDYEATSYSYRWTIDSNQHDKEIIFNLESINLDKDFGTSLEQLMKTSE